VEQVLVLPFKEKAAFCENPFLKVPLFVRTIEEPADLINKKTKDGGRCFGRFFEKTAKAFERNNPKNFTLESHPNER
jgi:hypothetical protein